MAGAAHRLPRDRYNHASAAGFERLQTFPNWTEHTFKSRTVANYYQEEEYVPLKVIEGVADIRELRPETHAGTSSRGEALFVFAAPQTSSLIQAFHQAITHPFLIRKCFVSKYFKAIKLQ